MRPVVEITNQDIDYDTYMDCCMAQIFDYEIFLTRNKRVTKDGDREILKEMFEYCVKIGWDTLINFEPFNTIFGFQMLKTIDDSYRYIAYTNQSCESSSKQVRKHKTEPTITNSEKY